MSIIESAPNAILRHEEDLPFVDLGDGSLLQVLQVDLAQGIWIIRNRFTPGYVVQTHRHTGSVYAFTTAGAWHYRESPDDVNLPGSDLFEPAGSVHTLHVLDDNEGLTDVWFTINGANLNLDANGQVEYVIDAATVLGFYRAACADQHGISDPAVVVTGA